MAASVKVAVEQGRKRTFASALDWPGWSRAATSVPGALDALEAYRDRYAGVLRASGLDTPTGRLTVVESTPGDATTDFGAPSQIAAADARALRSADRHRLCSILTACWARLDEVAASAGELRSGPRGGGRSVASTLEHVAGAEVAYARGLGLRVEASDDAGAARALRTRILEVVEATRVPDRVGKWPLRYGVRRIAWHACDHLFEIEDRAIS